MEKGVKRKNKEGKKLWWWQWGRGCDDDADLAAIW